MNSEYGYWKLEKNTTHRRTYIYVYLLMHIYYCILINIITCIHVQYRLLYETYAHIYVCLYKNEK